MRAKFVLFMISIILLSCGEEPGDPFFLSIDITVQNISRDKIFLGFKNMDFPTSPKISDIGNYVRVYVNTYEIGNDDFWNIYTNSLLFDNFSIKFYSSEITNISGWSPWIQTNMNLSDYEPFVYYITNISNGLSSPYLFDPNNSLPFYLSTNSFYNHEIIIKGLQTNI